MLGSTPTLENKKPEFLLEESQNELWVALPAGDNPADLPPESQVNNNDASNEEVAIGREVAVILDQIVSEAQRQKKRYPDNGRMLSRLGLALLNAGRLSEATKEFELALSGNPRQFVALSSLGRIAVLQKRFDEAAKLFSQLSAHYPEDIAPKVNLARLMVTQKNYEAAAALWREVVTDAPSTSQHKFSLAMILLRFDEKQQEEAITLLKEVIEADSTNARFYHGLGIAHSVREEFEEAAKLFRTTLQLAPNMVEAVHGLADALYKSGNYLETIQVLSPYVENYPEDFKAHEILALSHIQRKTYNRALSHLYHAARCAREMENVTSEHQARITSNMALCYWFLRDRADAERLYRSSISYGPKQAVPYLNLGGLYLEERKYLEARQVFHQCTELFSHDWEPWRGIAISYHAQKHYTLAAEALRKAIATGEAPYAIYQSLLSYLPDNHEGEQESIDVLQQALERFPTDPKAINALGYLYLGHLNTGAARTLLSRLSPNVILDELRDFSYPEDQEVNVLLQATWGLLRLIEGDFEDAKKGYQQASQSARRMGITWLAKAAERKMHVEFARAYQRTGDITMARHHARAGQHISGTKLYVEDLAQLAQELQV